MTRLRIPGIVLGLLVAFAAANPATAGGSHSHSRFFLGLNFGVPCCYYAPAPYYYYPAYYPPPYYYYPPPPPAVYYAPAPVAAAPQCREWRGDARNEQTGQPFYGTACLMPDGRWHIVRQY